METNKIRRPLPSKGTRLWDRLPPRRDSFLLCKKWCWNALEGVGTFWKVSYQSVIGQKMFENTRFLAPGLFLRPKNIVKTLFWVPGPFPKAQTPCSYTGF